MKITRDMLNNYRRLKREIPILEAELVEMKKGDNGFNNSTIFDYRDGYPRPQSVVGFDWPLYEHRKKVLNSKKERVKAVERWINSIEDGQTRCVFRMFYIGGRRLRRAGAVSAGNEYICPAYGHGSHIGSL